MVSTRPVMTKLPNVPASSRRWTSFETMLTIWPVEAVLPTARRVTLSYTAAIIEMRARMPTSMFCSIKCCVQNTDSVPHSVRPRA